MLILRRNISSPGRIAQRLVTRRGEAHPGESVLHDCRAGEGPPAALPDPEGRGIHPLVYRGTSLRRSRNPTVGDAQVLLNNFLAKLGTGFAECTAPHPGKTPAIQQSDVRRLQGQLAARGQLPLTVDCRFGPSTELATKLFQTCKGLAADGKIGPLTWSVLETYRGGVLPAPPPPPPLPALPVVPAVRTETVEIVAKSVILPIGTRIGVIPHCPFSTGLLLAFAQSLEASVDDTCDHTRQDKSYRMFASRSFRVRHDGTRIHGVSSSGLVTDSGEECLLGTPVCLQPATPTIVRSLARQSGPNAFEFTWQIKGRPNLLAENGFQAVCPRTSVFIWHRVTGRLELRGGRIAVRTSIVGSQFPTHCLFVSGVRRNFVRQ